MKSAYSSNSPAMRTLIAIVIGLAVVLLIEVLLLGVAPTLQSPTSRSEAPLAAPVNEEALSVSPREDFQDVIDRSLFSWNRKPVLSEGGALDAQGLSGRWYLSGVVSAGDTRHAILVDSENSDNWVKLSEGGFVDKWKLESISPNEIELVYEGETTTLPLVIVERTVSDKGKRKRSNAAESQKASDGSRNEQDDSNSETDDTEKQDEPRLKFRDAKDASTEQQS